MKNRYLTLISMVLAAAVTASASVAAKVDGFRSAKFGAKEKAVVVAAIKDLHVNRKAIRRTRDPVSQVTILSVKVNNFGPLKVPATVSYVMGYKCDCLTQATVQWNLSDKLSQNARGGAMIGVSALVGQFQNKNWGKNEMFTNRVAGKVDKAGNGTIVFFRGQNKAGGAITLLGGPVKLVKGSKDQMTANIDKLKSVTLLYERNAAHPDVNKIDVSGF